MILQALRSWPADITQFILSKAMMKVLRSWPPDITQFILSKAMMKVLSRFVLTLVVAPDLVDSMEDVHAASKILLRPLLQTEPRGQFKITYLTACDSL